MATPWVRRNGARVKTLMNLPCARVMNYRHTGYLHSRAVTVLTGKLAGLGRKGAEIGKQNPSPLPWFQFVGLALTIYTCTWWRTTDTWRQWRQLAINVTRSLHNCSCVLGRSPAAFSCIGVIQRQSTGKVFIRRYNWFEVIDTCCSCRFIAGDRWTVKIETESNNHILIWLYDLPLCL